MNAINEGKISFSYESFGNSSYLVATLKDGFQPINYQMEMISNNEIANVLSANKHQNNEDIQIYYNVTSKISLAQAVSRKKMDKESFLNVVAGTITAFKEINEYQLVNTGILLDLDYIFVRSGSFEPHFVYLPVSSEDEGVKRVKDFIVSLILKDIIEVSSDNFVQIMLSRMNSDILTLADIEKIVNDLKKRSSASGYKANVEPIVQNAPIYNTPASAPTAPTYTPPVAAPVMPNIPQATVETPAKQSKGNKKEKKAEKKVKEEKSSNPKKTIFIAMQALFVAVILKLVTSGTFTNAETGSLDIKLVFVVLLVVGAADFILYREWFVNKKDSGEKPTKKAAPDKKGKKAAAGSKGFDIPGKASFKTAQIPQAIPTPQPAAQPVYQATPQPVQQTIPQPMAQAAYQPVQQPLQQAVPNTYMPSVMSRGMQMESDDTVILTEETAGAGYLEFYNNGLNNKIPFNKPSILIGRLRGSVDYVVENNKVGKIHAEFIYRDGAYYVKDYNSTNGTYINGSGQRIKSNVEHQIHNNDRITLANSEFILKC